MTCNTIMSNLEHSMLEWQGQNDSHNFTHKTITLRNPLSHRQAVLEKVAMVCTPDEETWLYRAWSVRSSLCSFTRSLQDIGKGKTGRGNTDILFLSELLRSEPPLAWLMACVTTQVGSTTGELIGDSVPSTWDLLRSLQVLCSHS